MTQVTLCPRAQFFDEAMAACKECTRGCPPGEELVGLCGGSAGRSNAECMPCLTGFYKGAAMSATSPCETCGAIEAPACGCVPLCISLLRMMFVVSIAVTHTLVAFSRSRRPFFPAPPICSLNA